MITKKIKLLAAGLAVMGLVTVAWPRVSLSDHGAIYVAEVNPTLGNPGSFRDTLHSCSSGIDFTLEEAGEAIRTAKDSADPDTIVRGVVLDDPEIEELVIEDLDC